MAQAGLPQVRLRARCARVTTRRPVARARVPVLGQAGAARVVGRDRARGAGVELSRRCDRVRPRPARDRRGQRDRDRGRVRGARAHAEARASTAGRDRPAPRGGLVRLRGQVRARRDGARGPGADLGRRDGGGCGISRCAAFAASGCSGLARADFFVDGEEVLVNELNTMPGFTATAVYGKLWEATGAAVRRRCVTRLCEIAHRALRARARVPVLRTQRYSAISEISTSWPPGGSAVIHSR